MIPTNMKHIILSVIACIVFTTLQAQVIQGTVYDAKTRETIPGVAIFLDGTTLITTSDKDGKFRLDAKQKMNANLVFSHLSYESLTITHPFEYSEKEFYLHEKVNTISAVTVVAEHSSYTRAQLMKIFKEHFLGDGVAGKSCVILNEDDIILRYDDVTNMLSASSRAPLIIENNYLAYRITYDLQQFVIQYEVGPNPRKFELILTSIMFKGISLYEDLSPRYHFAYKTRRDEIYIRSRPFFWKNLVAKSLKEANFKVYVKLQQIDMDKYFTIVNETAHKEVQINPGTNMATYHPAVKSGIVYGIIDVLNNNRFSSEVIFLTDHVIIDDFGNLVDIESIFYRGNFGQQRLGEMLPLDYVYNPPPPSPNTPQRRR